MSLLTIRDVVGFTKPPRGSAVFFAEPMSLRKVDEKTNTTTVTNSTAETTLGSFTVPALVLFNKGAAAVSVAGTVLNDTTAATTLRLKAKLIIGGSTVTFADSTAINLPVSITPRSWGLDGMVVGTTLSTQLRTWSELRVSAPSTARVAPAAYAGYGYSQAIVPNSSNQSTITVTGQLSTASTDFSASVDVGTLWQVN